LTPRHAAPYRSPHTVIVPSSRGSAPTRVLPAHRPRGEPLRVPRSARPRRRGREDPRPHDPRHGRRPGPAPPPVPGTSNQQPVARSWRLRRLPTLLLVLLLIVTGSLQELASHRAGGLPRVLADGSATYLWAHDQLVADVITANAAAYPATDALGSVRARTDATGDVTATADWDAFGNPRATSGTQGAFGWTGEQHDPETGLTYLRARHYAPGPGHFLFPRHRLAQCPRHPGLQPLRLRRQQPRHPHRPHRPRRRVRPHRRLPAQRRAHDRPRRHRVCRWSGIRHGRLLGHRHHHRARHHARPLVLLVR